MDKITLMQRKNRIMKILLAFLTCPLILCGQIMEPMFLDDVPVKNRPIYHYVKFKLIQAEIDIDESTDVKTFWTSEAKKEAYQDVLDYIVERASQ